MTNINCLSNCIYQKEGKCCFENVDKCISKNNNNNCAYFVENSYIINRFEAKD